MGKLVVIMVLVSFTFGYTAGWLLSNLSVLHALLMIAGLTCGSFLLLSGPVDKSIQ